MNAALTLSYAIVNGGSGYEIPKLSYTLDGSVRSANLSLAPTSYAVDPGTAWSVPTLLLDPNAVTNVGSEIWALNATLSPPYSGMVNASFLENFTYFHMYRFGLWYSVSDSSTVGAPMIQAQTWDTRVSVPAGFPYYVDAGSPFSYPALLNGSVSEERWALNGSANGTVTGPGSFTGAYFHQYRVSFGYVVEGGSSTVSPSVHYLSFGTNVSVEANATVWADAGRAYAYAVALTAGDGGVRVGASSGTVGNVTAPGTVTVTYGLQYLLTVVVVPGALDGNVSGAGWYDAGSIATVSAAAPAGWEFAGWSGNASGASPSATVTMSAPANVTALFYAGLTIAADGGDRRSSSRRATPARVPGARARPCIGSIAITRLNGSPGAYLAISRFTQNSVVNRPLAISPGGAGAVSTAGTGHRQPRAYLRRRCTTRTTLTRQLTCSLTSSPSSPYGRPHRGQRRSPWGRSWPSSSVPGWSSRRRPCPADPGRWPRRRLPSPAAPPPAPTRRSSRSPRRPRPAPSSKRPRPSRRPSPRSASASAPPTTLPVIRFPRISSRRLTCYPSVPVISA